MVTPAQASRRSLAPGDKLGKHEVIRQIAIGGMAELYLTRTVGLEGFEKLVCVKRILPQFSSNPGFVNMFLNEARLAATLHHPNIAQVYDIGQDAGEYFFSMEYVHGEDLGRLVATGRENGVPISLDCALTLAAGLCAGLHHAHEKVSPEGKPLGVVHRDVSPTNVLVSYDGAVKLVDFGIARAGGEPSSQTGLKGKISYMSPEQCRGKVALDRRSDVFSVGTILYELTTGRLPFVDETEYGVLQQIVTRDAEPPSQLIPSYPAALEAIVMRALARDPGRRFSTALELQNQLEDYAHDNRLRVSPLVLARLMSTLFPARLEEWDHARAQGAFFVEQHVVRTLIESGKTADGSPQHVPQPLPPPDDGSGLTAIPTRSSALDADSQERTELGPRPRLTPPRSAPRMSTPHPAPLSTPPPGALAPPSQRPLRAPAPGSLLPPPPPIATPAGRGSPRPVPVPNMPGAVPIVMPLPAPPIPSGGTLVSSATQAGKPPPVPAQALYGSSPTAPPGYPAAGHGPGASGGFAGQGRSGQGEPAGFASQGGGYAGQGGTAGAGSFAGPGGGGSLGYAGQSGSSSAGYASQPGASSPGYAGQPGSGAPGYASQPGSGSPGYAGQSGSGAPGYASQPGSGSPDYAGQSGPGGYSSPARFGHSARGASAGGAGAAQSQDMASNSVGDVTEQVRITSARPTLMVRRQTRSKLPLGLGIVAAVGAAIGIWLAIGADVASDPARDAARKTERPAEIAPAAAAVESAPAAKTEEAPGTPSAEPTASPPTEPATAPPTEPVASPPTEPATADPTAVANPAPPATSEPPATAPAAPKTAAGSPPATRAAVPPPTEPKADPSKKKPGRIATPDPRKAAKPKGGRTEAKRTEPKRGQKPEAKEQPWNEDSVFLPTATPKR